MNKVLIILPIFIMIFILSSISANAYDSGLNYAFYFDFYESSGTIAHDISPAGNNGTFTGGYAYPKFNTTDYIEENSLEMNGFNLWPSCNQTDIHGVNLSSGVGNWNDNISIVGWFKPRCNAWETNASYRGLITRSSEDSWANIAWELSTNQDDNTLRCEFKQNGGNAFFGKKVSINIIPCGIWNLLLCTFNNGIVTLIINQTSVGTSYGTNTSIFDNSTSNIIRLGTEGRTGSHLRYGGVMDNVFVTHDTLNLSWAINEYNNFYQLSQTIIKPLNQTYFINNVSINGTCNIACNTTYSLDGGANNTISTNSLTFNTNLSVSGGAHKVYICSVKASDPLDFVCDMVYFSADNPSVSLASPSNNQIFNNPQINFSYTPITFTSFGYLNLYLNTSGGIKGIMNLSKNTNFDTILGCYGGNTLYKTSSSTDEIRIIVQEGLIDAWYNISTIRYNATTQTIIDKIVSIQPSGTYFISDIGYKPIKLKQNWYFGIAYRNVSATNKTACFLAQSDTNGLVYSANLSDNLTAWRSSNVECYISLFKVAEDKAWLFISVYNGSDWIIEKMDFNSTANTKTNKHTIYSDSLGIYSHGLYDFSGTYYLYFSSENGYEFHVISSNDGDIYSNDVALIGSVNQESFLPNVEQIGNKYYMINSEAAKTQIRLWESTSPNGTFNYLQTLMGSPSDYARMGTMTIYNNILYLAHGNWTTANNSLAEFNYTEIETFPVNSTNTSELINNNTNIISLNLPDGHYKLNMKICNNANLCSWANSTGNITFSVKSAPSMTITIYNPLDNTYTNSTAVNFGYYPISYFNYIGCYLHGISGTIGNSSYILNNAMNYFNPSLIDGDYNWFIECCDDMPSCLNTSSYFLSIDSTIPVIQIAIPQTTTYYAYPNASFNYSEPHVSDCLMFLNGNMEILNCSSGSHTISLGLLNGSVIGSNNFTIFINDTYNNSYQKEVLYVFGIAPNISELNISFDFDISLMIPTAQYCISDTILKQEYEAEVCKSFNTTWYCANVTKTLNIFCGEGCDSTSQICRAEPILNMGYFLIFMVYMIAITFTPMILITHQTSKKKLKAIFDPFIFFFMLVIYLATDSFLFPAIVTLLGFDYTMLLIAVIFTNIFLPLILLLLIINNAIKDRY